MTEVTSEDAVAVSSSAASANPTAEPDVSLDTLRQRIRARYVQSEDDTVAELLAALPLDEAARQSAHEAATRTVANLRRHRKPSLMESFLSEYGLSTPEGVGLMCLAEAMLRVPDAATIDELIADKIEPSNWGAHLGHSSSSLVNASTWALMLTGKVLDDGSDDGDSRSGNDHRPAAPASALRQLVKRMGEPLVRTAVGQAMKLMGRQFVLGETIESALKEAREEEKKGFTYSYDMLGEAARTDADAERYFNAYAHAIGKLAAVPGDSVRERPGISVKLSALHARYEYTHKDTVMAELLPRAQKLVRAAAKAGIGFNIDAEEADRLDISLDVIEALLNSPETAGWHGFGVVVQAYGRRALPVIDWLVAAAERYDRQIMVRLVKGAYWDTEVKEAQVLGVKSFPVFTRKTNTDLSYMVCAKRLLDNRERVYPQFATHNAHTVCAVLEMAGSDTSSYEFQRLHGMGESVHEEVHDRHGTRCRIYAPVGAHRDLLAYLVRRLLENGANSSFVNQIVDEDVPPEEVARDPIRDVLAASPKANPMICHPADLYAPERPNSRGFRLNDPASISVLIEARNAYSEHQWSVAPMLAGDVDGGETREVRSPADPMRIVGKVTDASAVDVTAAIDHAVAAQAEWAALSPAVRGQCLADAADAYEEHIAEFCALACREAGKMLLDGIAEVREAVDFLRYYAAQAANGLADDAPAARGVVACISPWNFPLAIFTGQISAALAAGNAVVAKPAEQSPIIAGLAVSLLHKAGVPAAILQLIPGDGASVGSTLTNDKRIAGVCFTGSTEVAKLIEKSLAQRSDDDIAAGADPDPFLIAETGGLNAMIADSTALTEQVIRDVVVSAFQSCGQRCSALRVLYVQKDAEARTLEMLKGAMAELHVGDPWELPTDVGPAIDAEAAGLINDYIAGHAAAGRVVTQKKIPAGQGHYVSPTLIRVKGIADMEKEVFGPVLHIATFDANKLDELVGDINARGYGLTFGLHTRIDDRVQNIVEGIKVGNVYVNRNQIGAIVGSQPFGGEGLSGTGPKAGGPFYMPRFLRDGASLLNADSAASGAGAAVSCGDLRKALGSIKPGKPYRSGELSDDLQSLIAGHASETGDTTPINATMRIVNREHQRLSTPDQDAPAIARMADRAPGLPAASLVLPGPTGESNVLSWVPRGRVLIVGQDVNAARQQTIDALLAGCAVVVVIGEDDKALAAAAKSSLPLVRIVGRFDPSVMAALANRHRLPFDVMAVSGSPALARDCRLAMAEASDRVMPLVTTANTPERYLLERHVCIDTTAAGGNASLLASVE